jgi:hypothetical protein
MPVWITDSAIDPTWIKKKVSNLQHMSECLVEDISNGNRRGSKVKDGSTLLLKIVSQNDANETTTFVAKQIAPAGLALSRKLGLAREAMFYNILAPKISISSSKNSDDNTYSGKNSDRRFLCEPGIPKIYYSFGDMSKGSKFVIMEDLSEGFIDSGILFGPGNPNNWNRDLNGKIANAYPSNVPTSREVANQTFLAIARVHATFWRNKELLKEEYSWLRGSSWISGKDEESWWASQGLIQKIWQKYLEEYSHSEGDICWDPLVWKIITKAMKGISWESHRKRLNEDTHFCLVHGDFWPGNVMIAKDITSTGIKTTAAAITRGDNGVRTLRLLDWEMVGIGSGPQDLGQYMISNMNRGERRDCEERLVRNYYNELVVELGISDLAWEDCWYEYKIGGLERWIWFLVYFCGQPGSTMANWAQFFYKQIESFVHDHNISPEDVIQPRP